MHWEVDGRSKKQVDDIAKAVRSADHLYLATDPDREGEAISWHVLELLQQRGALKDVDVSRVVFHEITKDAVLDAIAQPARHRRRPGRRLSGAPGARLPGRLHPVAGAVAQAAGQPLGRPRAVGRAAPDLRARGRDRGLQAAGILDDRRRFPHAAARQLHRAPDPPRRRQARPPVARRRGRGQAAVAAIERRARSRSPRSSASRSSAIRAPPFTTSTLQQEASRKLGFGAGRTMRIAQQLYEGVDIGGETVGLITYMRTDSVTLSGEAIAASAPADRARLRRATTCPTRRASTGPRRRTPRRRTRRSARPTCSAGPPRSPRNLDDDQRRLYELIWKRTVASQMDQRRARPGRRRHRRARTG